MSKYGLIVALLVAICLGWYVSSLLDDLDKVQQENKTLTQSLRIQSDLQIRANAIDMSRTRELRDAKSKIDDLQRAVADGVKRLHINATCKAPTATTTGSVADGTRARLTDAAQRYYFTLRHRIETAHSQIAGLQDYIRDVCLAR
ncbi:lysis protein [Serratia aquatilis]|uniref:Lysis protein n=1 Tax=Serratia aquatilis TaxID=1737515 RepID=A0ABV6EEJ8_9GAMM